MKHISSTATTALWQVERYGAPELFYKVRVVQECSGTFFHARKLFEAATSWNSSMIMSSSSMNATAETVVLKEAKQAQ